jgi:hypothetical protein
LGKSFYRAFFGASDSESAFEKWFAGLMKDKHQAKKCNGRSKTRVKR